MDDLCRGRSPAQLQRCTKILVENLKQTARILKDSSFEESSKRYNEIVPLLKGPGLLNHQVRIAFVGDTGEGKSSCINALLDKYRLVSTDCVAACTSTVIEIAHHDQEDFVAEVEFMTRNEWRAELKDLLATALGERQNEDDALEANNAIKQILTVHQRRTEQELRTLDVEDLMKDPELKYLGKTETVTESAIDVFRAKVEDLIARKHPFWPLIVKVSLRVNAPVLSTGVVLVDIPGHDSNRFRAKMTSDAMRKADCIFACAKSSRIMDNRSTRRIIDQRQHQQMLLDGLDQNVTIIATNADVMDLDEARISLDLGDEFEQLDKEVQKAATILRDLGTGKGSAGG